MLKTGIYVSCLITIFITACSETAKVPNNSRYYSAEDYYNVEKYDVHTHLKSPDPYLPELFDREKFRFLSVNVNSPDNIPIEKQQEYALKQVRSYPSKIGYATTFSVDGWNDKSWQQQTIDYLKRSFDSGAAAVKIWKNIGMTLKDPSGKFVMIDDPRFDTVINFIQSNGIPVFGHLGEPKNCWLPIEQMTVANDRQYFKAHPQYHMFLHPEYPSYEDQINARDHMLDKHPDLKFVAAHLASVEWDVDEIAKRLDKYPNMAVETAARVTHLQHQAVSNHKKVYDFFIKYQDRILYGSDFELPARADSASGTKELHDGWYGHWKFFATDEELSDPQVTGKFNGLHLPKEVIDKIYFSNAQRWLPGLRKDR
jgi:predicted TIM-barrel fold metal-dependent hydrolase